MPLLFLIIVILGIYAEFSVAVAVAEDIGAGFTLLAMVGTAVVGLWLVRLQGFDIYRKINQTVQQGQSPVEEMLHGLMLFFAGFLLIIPGFISDTLGALLLIPPIRSFLISMGFWKNLGRFEVRTPGARQDGVIDGEFERQDEDAPEEKAGAKLENRRNRDG